MLNQDYYRTTGCILLIYHYPLKKHCPDKDFWPVSEQALCPTMKLTKLASVREALIHMHYEMTIPADIAAPARRAIERMVEIGRDGAN